MFSGKVSERTPQEIPKDLLKVSLKIILTNSIRFPTGVPFLPLTGIPVKITEETPGGINLCEKIWDGEFDF